MSTGFDFSGLQCIPAPSDARSWQYLPFQPQLQRDPTGKPRVTVVDVGGVSFLTLAATWRADEADLEALRKELALRLAEPVPDRLRLSFATVDEPRCSVLLGDGAGRFEAVATSTTSGVPPYDAVFGLSLADERLASARAGLRGQPGFLALEYAAGLRVPVTGSVTLSATKDELTAWFSASPDADRHQLVEQAVREGLAVVTLDVPEPCPGELATALYERVVAESARALVSWLDRASGDLRVSVTLQEDADRPVRAFADIGSIVAGASTTTALGGPHAAD